MPEMIESLPRDVIADVCGLCGWGVYPHEIAGEIYNGVYVDYLLHDRPEQISFVLCRDCAITFGKNMLKTPEQATLERIELEYLPEPPAEMIAGITIQPHKPAPACHNDKGERCAWLEMSKYRVCPYPELKCPHKKEKE